MSTVKMDIATTDRIHELDKNYPLGETGFFSFSCVTSGQNSLDFITLVLESGDPERVFSLGAAKIPPNRAEAITTSETDLKEESQRSI